MLENTPLLLVMCSHHFQKAINIRGQLSLGFLQVRSHSVFGNKKQFSPKLHIYITCTQGRHYITHIPPEYRTRIWLNWLFRPLQRRFRITSNHYSKKMFLDFISLRLKKYISRNKGNRKSKKVVPVFVVSCIASTVADRTPIDHRYVCVCVFEAEHFHLFTLNTF